MTNKDDELDEHQREVDLDPKIGQVKMVRVRRDGVDSVELRLWNGTEWIDFSDYLNPGEESSSSDQTEV